MRHVIERGVGLAVVERAPPPPLGFVVGSGTSIVDSIDSIHWKVGMVMEDSRGVGRILVVVLRRS